jgi:hypothetical protein
MLMTAKARESRSKQRQALCKELGVWLQREKDAEVWPGLSAQERAEKLSFCRQEQAKLRKALRALDRGFTRQRAWNQGKLLY